MNLSGGIFLCERPRKAIVPIERWSDTIIYPLCHSRGPEDGKYEACFSEGSRVGRPVSAYGVDGGTRGPQSRSDGKEIRCTPAESRRGGCLPRQSHRPARAEPVLALPT